MAQKSPTPSLTIAISGTWTSLWYYDFTESNSVLVRSLHLHYLVNAFFSLKHRLIYNMSVLQSNNLIFVNLNTVNTMETLDSRFKIKQRKKFINLKTLKYLNFLKKRAQHRVATAQIVNINSFFIPYKKAFPSLRFSLWRYTTTAAMQTQYGALLAKRKQIYGGTPLYIRKFRAKRRFFSTSASSTPLIKLVGQQTQVRMFLVEQQLKKVTLGLPKDLLRRWQYLYTDVFPRMRPFKKRTWLQAYKYKQRKFFLKKWSKRRVKSYFLKFSLLRHACQHVSGFHVKLNLRKYLCVSGKLSALKAAPVFARWCHRPYFLIAVTVTLVSLSRGSCVLLVNLLVRLLKHSKTHSSILYIISAALKFFLCDHASARMLDNVPCAGARLEVIGTVDGKDRAKTFRAQYGAIPTSTLSSVLDMEYAVCGTIYGVLGITLWYFMKPVKPKLDVYD